MILFLDPVIGGILFSGSQLFPTAPTSGETEHDKTGTVIGDYIFPHMNNARQPPLFSIVLGSCQWGKLPSRHCWGYGPGTMLSCKVSATHSKIGHRR